MSIRQTITIPPRTLPVLAHADVVVCGGGPAGCASAIAAARHGARVVLIEKEGYLGGATVAQNVSVILSTNGIDFQGIWHDWARRLLELNGISPLHRWANPFYDGLHWLRASVNPEQVKLVWQQMMQDAGVQVIHFATLTDAIRDDKHITGVTIHTRAGGSSVLGQRFIDATGDGILSDLAGVAWHRGVRGSLWAQEVSLVGRIGGIQYDVIPGHPGTMAGIPERLFRKDMKEVDPLDILSVSSAMQILRQQMHNAALDEGEYLISTASELGVRTSRIINGCETSTDEDCWTLRKRTDGIARSSWEIDIHPPDARDPEPRMFHSRSPEYRKRAEQVETGDWFDIPYGAVIAEGVDNLLLAGRIVSSEYLAQGSLRIQQTCMSTGEAAGVAAALSIQEDVLPEHLPCKRVLDQLKLDRDLQPAFDIF